jgi:hypothetical protein
MRKLKLAIVLPIGQVLIASILLLWADRTPVPRYWNYPYHPAAWLICKDLNAPAMLLLIPFGGNWYNLPLQSVPIVSRGLFLMSVAGIWYLVGRALDQREAPRPVRKRQAATVLVVHSLSLVLGGLLFYAGWDELSGPNAVTIGPFLAMAWAVSLIFLSGRSLVRMIRRGLARTV